MIRRIRGRGSHLEGGEDLGVWVWDGLGVTLDYVGFLERDACVSEMERGFA